MAHREKILSVEIRCVSLVSRGSNSVRNSSATAPVTPDVPNAWVAALRGSCGNGMA